MNIVVASTFSSNKVFSIQQKYYSMSLIFFSSDDNYVLIIWTDLGQLSNFKLVSSNVHVT